MIPAHRKDKNLNVLRWIAFGAMGVYVLALNKKKAPGTLGAEEDFKLSVDSDRMVDSAMPWLGIEPEQRDIVARGAKHFLRELFRKGNLK